MVADVPVTFVTDTPLDPIVAKVPDVGNVTEVFAVKVPVKVNAPEKATLPPIVMVLLPLFTPVPPHWPPINDPCHVPVVIVPTDCRLDNVVTAVFTNVPLVGRVTVVGAVVVKVNALAPEVEKAPAVFIAPPNVMLKLLLTPEPPFCDDKGLEELMTKPILLVTPPANKFSG
jgi:hypothetical protein